MAADPTTDAHVLVADAEARLGVLIRQLQGMIREGPGVPTDTPTSPILHLRTDGTVGSSLYLFRAGAWAAIA